MKAISIMQPWAWLIVHGFKDVENRVWRSDFTGRVLIHASKKFDVCGYNIVRRDFPHIIMPERKDFQLGGVIGAADIVGCITRGAKNIQPQELRHFHESPWFADQFAFCMANPMALETMIPAKGKLRFFDIPFGGTA